MINKFQTTLLAFVVMYFAAGSSVFAAFTSNINNPIPITHSVTVQPIVVSDDDGSNTATFFGNSSQKIEIESLIDQIWSQAGIDVNFLAANTWDNSFANSGTVLPRPRADLGMIVSDANLAGQTNPNANVINMFFVNVAAGFPLLGPNFAAGLALTPGNGITQYVGSDLISSAGGQEVIASVVAHEIGHNLGLEHSNSLGFPEGTENLMWSSIQGSDDRDGQRLNSTQIFTALNSNLSVAITPVPLPAAVWLFGSALLALFGVKSKACVFG